MFVTKGANRLSRRAAAGVASHAVPPRSWSTHLPKRSPWSTRSGSDEAKAHGQAILRPGGNIGNHGEGEDGATSHSHQFRCHHRGVQVGSRVKVGHTERVEDDLDLAHAQGGVEFGANAPTSSPPASAKARSAASANCPATSGSARSTGPPQYRTGNGFTLDLDRSRRHGRSLGVAPVVLHRTVERRAGRRPLQRAMTQHLHQRLCDLLITLGDGDPGHAGQGVRVGISPNLGCHTAVGQEPGGARLLSAPCSNGSGAQGEGCPTPLRAHGTTTTATGHTGHNGRCPLVRRTACGGSPWSLRRVRPGSRRARPRRCRRNTRSGDAGPSMDLMGRTSMPSRSIGIKKMVMPPASSSASGTRAAKKQ